MLAWPLAARAQQTMPVIGLLGSGSPGALFTAALAQGLQETGYVEGQNVLVEYRRARGAYDRLPDLAAELVDRRVSVIITFGTAAARPAMTASRKAMPVIPLFSHWEVIPSQRASSRASIGREVI